LPPPITMFQLTLVEHVRLSFGGALAAYEGHAEAAARLTRLTSYAKIGLLALSGITAVVGAVAVGDGFAWQLALAILATATFASCAAYVGFNQQPLIYGHRLSAARMWVVCEKYRALLAEMHENAIDHATLQERRNALLQESAAVLQEAAPDDRYTYQIAREALAGPKNGGYPDWFIDRYLPPPLRKEAPASGPS
jgi:conflict system pore-forming effector with SLATT domain